MHYTRQSLRYKKAHNKRNNLKRIRSYPTHPLAKLAASSTYGKLGTDLSGEKKLLEKIFGPEAAKTKLDEMLERARIVENPQCPEEPSKWDL